MRTLNQLKPLQVLSLTLSLLLTHSAFAQNSGERGGGDTIVGQFQEIESTVMKNLDHWVEIGALKINPVDLAKLKKVAANHKVISLDHACLTGEKKNGECLHPQDEKDAVNEPFAKVPLIIVGRLRWPTVADKEVLVLHELLEVSLTKNSQLVRDKKFEESYAWKRIYDAGWKDLKTWHLSVLKDLRREEANFESVDMSVLNTFLKTMQLSTDYKTCVAMTGKSQKEREARLKVCMPLLNQFLTAVQEYVKNDMSKRLTEISNNMQRIHQDYRDYLVKNYREAESLKWAKWAVKEQDQIIAETQEAFRVSNGMISRDSVYAILDKASPYTGDLSENIVFVFDDQNGAMPKLNKLFSDCRFTLVKMLYESHQKAVDRANAQIDPPTE